MEEENKLLKELLINQGEMVLIYSKLGKKIEKINTIIQEYGLKKASINR